ncbi:hypothetical protein AI2694V1_3124 [Enterobacter cloacae]|nr:hypothetical protein AI2694V1_3124 [Enterobacter cloacae]CAE7496265.1 hypothetical protein AI2674V1_3111 [Enterobacter cloacae]CAE7523093.1 hypothetical protein AI2679V1_3124 [Enterobacter cloacae]CAH3775219.1 hypothetical protein AI2679V1_3124 [Enterobacter cloacae]CAH3780389.1 hypothetical protein AI2674V1_3111 [Enterobacter cloacae]
MTSLTAFNRLPQLRMIPVPGAPLFRYERRIANRWVPCNHSRAVAIVGVYYRKAKRLCAKLTEGSKTTEGSPFGLSGGNQRLNELSTRDGYDHECFSPLEQFKRKFTELKDDHEH